MTKLKKTPRPKIVKETRSGSQSKKGSPAKKTNSGGRTKNYVIEELTKKAVTLLLASATELDASELYVLLQQEYRKLNEKLYDEVLARLMGDKRIAFNAQSKTFRHNAPKTRTGVVLCYAQTTPFVVDDLTGEKYTIVDRQSRLYLPGDCVTYSTGFSSQPWDDFRQYATVTALTDHAIDEIVGEVVEKKKKTTGEVSYHFRKFDPRLSYISVGFTQKNEELAAWVGKKVIAKIKRYATAEQAKFFVEIERELPVDNDADLEIELAVRQFDLPHEFPQAVMEEAEALPGKVYAKDRLRRVDLRDVPFCTIDGEDARDFDDAVYCEKLEDGAYRLLVAIADVSYYVKPDHPIDEEAQKRSTSVYFPRRVIPMLPEKLCNGICSLNPNVDRCTMVCDMVINNLGMVTAYQFYRAVIHSHARLTYTCVWNYLQGRRVVEKALPEEMRVHIDDLYDLYKVLRQARDKRGAIDFETRETEVKTNDNGEIVAIVAKELTDANRLIEECMLAANTCAADFILRNNHLSLFRVHDAPSAERLLALRQILAGFGLTLGGGNKPTALDYEKVIEEIKGRQSADAIQMAMLRSMQRAVYSPDNIGHYGLGYEAYTHFTSPIRRYPDLLVHRTIQAILTRRHYRPKIYPGSDAVLTSFAGKSLERTLAATPRSSENAKHIPGKDSWVRLGKITSACERRADDASRDIVAWLKCRFMASQAQKGKKYSARITAVTGHGLYVELDEIFIEGFVHISEIGYDYFVLNNDGTLVGQDFGQRYAIGDRVRVSLLNVDEDRRRIDFRIVNK